MLESRIPAPQTASPRRYARRLILPGLLLLACVLTWTIADRLGQPEIAQGQPTTDESVTTPLFSVRRMPEFATASQQQEARAAAIAGLPSEPGGLSCAVILVDGEPVLSERPDLGLVPSYAQLLITGHAAIDILGRGYRYETQAMAPEQPDDSGRLFGDLYLVGGGDPVLMSHNYAMSFRPALTTNTSLGGAAVSVAVLSGVTRIDGGIVAIERRYDTQRSLPGWPATYAEDGLVGPLSALQLDDGFAVRPSTNGGVAVPSEDPALMAAERFALMLRGNDVEIFGPIRSLRDDEVLPELVPIGRVSSPPLDQIVFQMLAANDASAAEMIIKELGFATNGAGTTQAGGRAIRDVLVDQGVAIDVPFRDGSGLDPLGSTTCQQLATTADTIADAHPTIAVLPAHDLPGVFGGAFADGDLISDLRLVGGVVNGNSGFVARTVDSGRQVTIASIINRPGGPIDSDLAYQRALVEVVDELRSSISVEAIAASE